MLQIHGIDMQKNKHLPLCYNFTNSVLGDYDVRLLVYRVQGLQSKICQSKAQYAQSLRNLEDISESIHERQVLFIKGIDS